MEFVSKNLKETKEIASKFIHAIVPVPGEATVVGLYGDLGSGKTAFTKCVAELLGIKDEITSPTFVIEKIYALQHQQFTHFIHIDAYRLESELELVNLGWKELLKNPQNLIFIEWPEKVSGAMPILHKKIFFTFVDEKTRKIEIVD